MNGFDDGDEDMLRRLDQEDDDGKTARAIGIGLAACIIAFFAGMAVCGLHQ
jgi:hypothetical protein